MDVASELQTKDLITLRAGDILFREGEAGDCMYLLLAGRIQIVKTLGPEKQEINTMEVGDFLGEMAILNDSKRSATAIALEESKLLRAAKRDFPDLLINDPEVPVRMLRRLSNNLLLCEARLADALEAIESEKRKSLFAKWSGRDEAETQPLQLAHFVLVGGTARWPISKPMSILGRADRVTGVMPEVDLGFVDTRASVSRLHARIYFREGVGFEIEEELAVRNGTRVNGVRLRCGEPFPLRDGDEVALGLVLLRFHVGMAKV